MTTRKNTIGPEPDTISLQGIRQKPLNQRTVQEEYRLAKHEKRQPCCPYCKQPLNISQAVYHDSRYWVWDEKTKSYIQSNGFPDDTEEPECQKCRRKDWDFVDNDLVDY